MIPKLLPNDFKNAVAKADRYARKKTYKCLVPGCDQDAIECHGVPRQTIKEALADKMGQVYTTPPYMASMLTTEYLDQPKSIVRVGLNDATVFKGFCAKHDLKLFLPAETTNFQKRRHMEISLHLRALATEYCRKRYVIDFGEKLNTLVADAEYSEMTRQAMSFYAAAAELLKKFEIERLLYKDHPLNGSVSYLTHAFAGNLGVSACGVFCFDTAAVLQQRAFSIGYNLISHSDVTYLVLTIFEESKQELTNYLNSFTGKGGKVIESILNDIAFLRGEEPVISPKLWHSLTNEQQYEVQLSLRHPNLRHRPSNPDAIKVKAENTFEKISKAALNKLPNAIKEFVESSHYEKLLQNRA